MLARLGLNRPELRAWALYDWANSVFWTTILQIFPIYFAQVAAAGLPPAVTSARFAIATTIGTGLIALVSPLLGALADYGGAKKKMLALFLTIGVPATAALFFVQRGDWLLAIVLFVIGNVGVAGTLVFYDSLLPHVARADEMDRVSTAGFALGYLGGGLLLALNLLWIQRPALFGLRDDMLAIRLSFVSAAVWWAVFSIPLFRYVPEPPRRLETDERGGENAFRVAGRRLFETLREVREYRDAFLMLLAFLLYNDGIQTIIRMATLYGTQMGIARGSLIAAVLLVQFVGVPCAFGFGALAGRIGAKRAIFIAIAVYVVIALIGYGMRTAFHFFLLAGLVGTVMGGNQALSRSLFASLIPRHKSSEFFGFFGVFEKFAGVLGPALFAGIIAATGSSRPAILALVLFFAGGALLLWFVDVDRGQRLAREVDARVGPSLV